MKIRIFISLLFVLLVEASLAASSPVLNLRVVWSTNPQTEAVVVWDGDQHLDDSILLYDTVSREDEIRRDGPGKTKYAQKANLAESGLYPDIPTEKPKNADPDWMSSGPSPEYYYHQAILKDLEPGTVYYLAVRTEEGIGREYHFKTAPKTDERFKLIYAGDSRTHIEVARQINQWISEKVQDDESIIGLLHGGDYASTPRRELWIEWLESYALTTTKGGKLLPIIPVIGNHDVLGESPIFRLAYGYPGGEDDYFTCRLTPEVGIVCLNTEISAEGNQRQFLRETLGDMRADKVKWQIAAFHKPAYPAVKKPSVAKVSWVPLFEEYNIDLVLESDGHCIKRTVPIRGDEESADGIVYLGEGGYGAPQRDPKLELWYLQGDNAFASKGDHVMILDVDGNSIHYTTVLNSGEVVDSASFKARRR